MKRKILTILIIFISLNCASFADSDLQKTQKEEYQNDVLYSEEYFDYLIECASLERQNEIDEKKAKEKELKKTDKKTGKSETSEITFDEDEIIDEETDVITDVYVPFKLHIQEDNLVPKYAESFKKVDTKTIIPIGGNVSFTQNMSKFKNKYNSHDYRIQAGAEYSPTKYFTFSSGLETNFSGYNQDPTSKKFYLTPSFTLGDKVSLSFINKYNMYSGSFDHDISLKVSPMKSKAFDFGVYSGLTRKQNGAVSESVSFSTNIYLK